MQFRIIFDVEERSAEGAQEWLARTKQILQANRNLLVTSDGSGQWCEGHIEVAGQGQAVAQQQQSVPPPGPPPNLALGPRE